MSQGNDSFRERWKKFIIRNRAQETAWAVIAIIAGILFLVMPGHMETVIGRIIGIFLMLAGIGSVVTGVRSVIPSDRYLCDAVGGLMILFGLIMMIDPQGILAVIMVLIAIFLFISAVQQIVRAMDLKDAGFDRWQISLLSGIISLLLGLLVMLHPFATVGIVAGISCLYFGITKLIVTSDISKKAKDVGDVIGDFVDDVNGDMFDSTASEEEDDVVDGTASGDDDNVIDSTATEEDEDN